MPEPYDYGVRTLAEQLFVFMGRTYAEIAKETGVSQSQIERWGKAGEWQGKRKQHLNTKAQEISRLIGIKDRILDNLEAEIQAGTVHQLLSGYRQASSIIEERLSPGQANVDRPALFLEFLQFEAEVLRVADPEGLKILSRSFDLIVERAKERYAKTA